MVTVQRLAERISVSAVVGMVALLGSISAMGADHATDTPDWRNYSNAQAGFSFRYPKDWKVEDEGFYETAGGSKAKEWSLTLHREGGEEDSDNWIQFNPRQFQEGDGRCVRADGNQICTYSSDAGVLEIYRKVVATTKGKQGDGAYAPPPGSKERKEILDALRKEVKRWSGPDFDVVFVVDHVSVHKGWAWIATSPRSRDGASQYEGVSGLLRKEKGQWKVRHVRPCCGECADDPDCEDDIRYFKKLRSSFPSAPPDIFPAD